LVLSSAWWECGLDSCWLHVEPALSTGYLQDQLTRDSCRTGELLQAGDDAEQIASTLLCTYLCPCDFPPELQTKLGPYGRNLIKGSAASIEDCQPCEGLDAVSYPQIRKTR